MTNTLFSIRLTLFADALLLIASLVHIPALLERATFPFSVITQNDALVIDHVQNISGVAAVTAGDTLLAVDDHSIAIPEQLEFVADHLAIGEKVKITVIRNREPVLASVTTVPFYPTYLYILIAYFIGFSFLLVGVFVLLNRAQDKIVFLFHWMMVLIGTVIMITWGKIDPGTVLTTLTRSLFFLTYIFGIAAFYIFTKLYCTAAPRFILLRITAVSGIAAALTAPMIYYHLRAISEYSLRDYAEFQWYFDIFHAAIIVAFIAGIVNIIRAYRSASTSGERNRLEWIMWGFFCSSTPFLLLYIVPQLLFDRYVVPEEYTTIFFIALPFSFGVSFIKHHLFDIRFLIKRTIVNTAFGVIIVVSYGMIVLLVATVVHDNALTSDQFIVVTITLVIAMALNPVRTRLQRFIDRLLFKTHTEYSRIIAAVSEELHHAVSDEQIFSALLQSIRTSLPVEECILYRRSEGLLISFQPNDTLNRTNVTIPLDRFQSLMDHPCTAIDSIVRSPEPDTVRIDNSLREKTGHELFLPIRRATLTVYGAVGISRLQIREQYESEEIMLLRTLCRIAGEHLERIRMMESIFREKEERKQAEELNRQKSDFVSYVSHELQTPLTAITMFAELLQKKLRSRKEKEQLKIIIGETERLSRLVNNLLDVSRIESGLKAYCLTPCCMNDIVNSVIASMSYVIEKHGFQLRTSFPRTVLSVQADSDALSRAIMNLISNAIKYSRVKKQITVTLTKKNNSAVCSIEDRGDGIPASQIPYLFDRFYRLPQHHRTVKGIGLGLSLVKHIMDAHHGSIRVRSTVGKGSAFTIILPLNSKVRK